MLYLTTKINHNGYFGIKNDKKDALRKISAPKCGLELIRNLNENLSYTIIYTGLTVASISVMRVTKRLKIEDINH